MHKILHALTAVSVLALSKGEASTDTWTGAVSSQLNLSGNWTPSEPSQPPAPGDQAIFGSALNYSPSLSDGSSFALYEVIFTDPSATYAFEISNSSQLNLGLSGDTHQELTSGISNSVTIASQQSFAVTDDGTIAFYGFSNADPNTNFNVLYSVEGTTAGNFLFYDHASAGNSQIFIGDTTGALNKSGLLSFHSSASAGSSSIQVGSHLGDSSIDFYSDSDTVFSTAGSSTILVGYTTLGDKTVDGVLTFHGYSTAGNSVITVSDSLGNGRLFFEDNSTAGSSTITLGNVAHNLIGHAAFNGSSGAGTSKISVINGSVLEFASGASGGESFISLSTGGSLSMAGPASHSLASLTSDSSSIVTLDDVALTINYSGSSSIEIAGAISGSGGSLIKSGSGVVILSATCSYSGLTTVEMGTLTINGTVAGDVLVAGGTVSGTGSCAGDLTVTSGTISPGNSPGTLIIAGDYIQSSSSTYLVQIEEGNSSLIQVEGTATLDHSPIDAYLLDSFFYTNHPYLIFQVADGITGSFSDPTTSGVNSRLLQANLAYEANTQVYMTLQTTLENVAQTSNQIKVGERLDVITSPSLQEAIFLSDLVRLGTGKARRSLEQLSGEPYTNWLFIQERANQKFLSALYEPLRSDIISSTCKECLESSFTVWVDGGVGRSFLNSRDAIVGLHLNSYETSIGIHKNIADQWTLGIAGFYEHDRASYQIGAYGNNGSWLGGVYSLYRPEKLYVLLDATSGYSQNKVKRFIDVESGHWKAVGKAKVSQVGLYLESGFDIRTTYVLFQPFVGLQGEHYHLGKIREHGTSPITLSILKKDRNTANSRLGIHITGYPDACWGFFGIDCAWDCLLTSQNQDLTAYFQSFGNSFSLSGIPLQRNSMEGAAFVHASLGKCWNAFAKVSGQKWHKASTYNLLIGVEASW